MQRIRRFFVRVAVLLSVLPFLTYGYWHSGATFLVTLPDHQVLSAPRVDLPVSFAPVPIYSAAVPVLCYHGIRRSNDPYSNSQRRFAEDMAMLSQAGFHTVSIEQYHQFLSGNLAALPTRPILITFDDGRVDSYRGADKVLARYHFRATMFVITGFTGTWTGRFFLQWRELRRMEQSGRWDIQLHAGHGHVLISVGPDGQKGPYYANLKWGDGHLESYAAYQQRVSRDLLWGEAVLRQHIPGYRPYAIAVPYGNYGQNKTNDGMIRSWLDSLLVSRFGAVFVQDRTSFTGAGDYVGDLQRIVARPSLSVEDLYRELVQCDPGTIPLSLSPGSWAGASLHGAVPAAQGLLRNLWPVPDRLPVHLAWPLRWNSWTLGPMNDPLWVASFYSLQPTQDLLRAYRQTGNTRYLGRLLEILRSYAINDETRADSPSTFDQPDIASCRAFVLVNTYVKLATWGKLPPILRSELKYSITKLGRFLASYEPRSSAAWSATYGYNEAAALLLIADYFPAIAQSASWRRLATDRFGFMEPTTTPPVDASLPTE